MILSDINGCNEIVKNHFNGILVPVKNPDALADAMIFLRSNPELCKYFTGNSLDIVNKKFSNQAIWALLKAEYKELLATHKN